MTTIPFSLIMEQERNGANGFEIVHAIAELKDNAYDAGSKHFTLALLREPGTTRATLIEYDTGKGAADLDAFYSIGSSVVQKTTGRGLKNYGNRAAIGRLMADNIIHISRAEAAPRCSTLTFHLAALYAAVDATPTPRDYRVIDAQLNRTLFSRSIGGLNDDIREKLIALHARAVATIDDPLLHGFLASVLANTQPSYHLMLLEYENFPPGLDLEIVTAFQSYRLSYYKALQEGLTMQYLRPEGCIRYTAAHAIDPLSSTAPRLTGQLEFRGDTMVRFSVPAGDDATVKDFYLTVLPTDRLLYDGRTYKGPFRRTPPDLWAATPVTGRVEFACSVPDGAEQTRQKEAAGSLYRHRDDLRGVYLRYMDRILGPPLYSDDWISIRNVVGLRVELAAWDQPTAQTFFCVPTKKHSATYSNLHRVLQAALNWIVNRVIIPKYSYYTVLAPESGVTDWRMPHFCLLMEDTRSLVPPPSPPVLPVTPPVPVPPVQPDESKKTVTPAHTDSRTSSMTGGGGAGVSTNSSGVVCRGVGATHHAATHHAATHHAASHHAASHHAATPPTAPHPYEEFRDFAKYLYIHSNLDDLCKDGGNLSKLSATRRAKLIKAATLLRQLKDLLPDIGIKHA